MSLLGRYASRYTTSEFDVDARNSCQAGNIGPNSDLVDIACADFGSVRIHCWPGTESSFHGGRRRWGRRRESNAAIVPFRLQAGQSMRCKVKLVERDLQFAAKQPDVGCIGLRSAPSSTTVPTCDGKEVCLIELPAPDSVSGPGQSVTLATPWLFNSEPITSNDGFARTARWTWTANDHKPCILHGAAVVQHPNQPFLVTCKVRGEASIPLANEKVKVKLKLRFDSDELGPRLWYFHPQEPESDLLSFEQAIAGLNAEIKEMNMKDCIRESQRSNDSLTLV
ncbi:hypothetical protein LTR24_010070 [Lithohypha guttulata]|uniref:Uncharacterized protein n=1 Tax=Lithohypha guttulata TaxID=1690604 RepID=A0ABR0JV26_9EURO|nr:hypothetical protein LTR24_010070 [Lithohypha guttulata]